MASLPLPFVGPGRADESPVIGRSVTGYAWPVADTTERTETTQTIAQEGTTSRRLEDLPDPGGLIFDLDGTLVDTVEARIEAWLDTFREIGFPAERRHVAGLIGADGKRLAREVAEVGGRRLSDDRAEAVDRRAGERYDEINVDPQALPGAREILAALHRSDLPWAIATSSRADQVTVSVRALEAEGDPHIVDGSQVTEAKPAPDLLLYAAERLGLPPQRCWYVGDATWDMRAAKAAGMAPIGVPTGAVSAETLLASGASVVIDSLDDLLADLRRRGRVS